MFKALCGEDTYSNAAVLTTMWSADNSSLEFTREQEREERLKDDYFAEILDEGGILGRVKSEFTSQIDVASAKEIFSALFTCWKDDKITLRIQHELIDDPNALLNETSAGRILLSHMDQTRQLYEAEITKVREAIADTNSEAPAEKDHLVEQQNNFNDYLKQLKRDQEAMKVSLIDVHRQEKDRLMTQLDTLE